MARFFHIVLPRIFWCLIIQFTTASPSNALAQQEINESACACFGDRDELRSAVYQFYYNGCSDTNNCNNAVVRKYGWPMGSWCVSAVTSMAYVFWTERSPSYASFNDEISSWNVSSVTGMGNMFLGASSFNQDLSPWDTSKVTDMYGMFSRASSFNQDLSSWNVSAVTNMGSMFWLATSFNQDLSSWDVSKVTDAERMFEGAAAFDESVVCDWGNAWNELVNCYEGPPISITTIVAVSLGLAACLLVGYYISKRQGDPARFDLQPAATATTAVSVAATTVASA